MPEEISDDKFKGEMIRMMQSSILKIDGLDKRVAGLDERVGALDERVGGLDKRLSNVEKDVGELKADVGGIKKDLAVVLGRTDDLITKVVQMYNRLFAVEKQLESFSARLTNLEREAKQIMSELHRLAENIDDNDETKAKVAELNARIEKLEEKVFK